MNWKKKVNKIREESKAKGITQNELSRVLGLHQSAISRLFSLKHEPRGSTITKIENYVRHGKVTK